MGIAQDIPGLSRLHQARLLPREGPRHEPGHAPGPLSASCRSRDPQAEAALDRQADHVLFLPNIHMFKFSNGHPDDEKDEPLLATRVIIDGGELLAGMLDKKTLGPQPAASFTSPSMSTAHVARAFIGCHQRVVNHWIVNRSYSIGIGDTIADKTMDDIVRPSTRRRRRSRVRERPRRRVCSARAHDAGIIREAVNGC